MYAPLDTQFTNELFPIAVDVFVYFKEYVSPDFFISAKSSHYSVSANAKSSISEGLIEDTDLFSIIFLLPLVN